MELYLFTPYSGLQPSPFCQKLEVYCRLAGITYRRRDALPMKAPKGKLPYMFDNGQKLADSGLIIEYLKRKHGDVLDAELSPQQMAQSHLIRRVCEESLYFVLVWARWLDDSVWPRTREMFFSSLPRGVRNVVPTVAQRSVRSALQGQGYGRHQRHEVYALGRADLAALAAVLQQQAFAVAERPASVDASLYAMLFCILRFPLETPLKAEAQAFPALEEYLARMDSHLAAA